MALPDVASDPGERPDAPARDLRVSVVVPSHARAERLARLLDALAGQSLPSGAWEVIVAHDYPAGQVQGLLEEHPLARAGVLRQVVSRPGSGTAARQRNLGWRAARAPLVAFTDDDCRPESDWLARLLEAADRAPPAIVQGATRPDPLDAPAWRSPHARSVHESHPPGPYAQTCNILYPRAALERVGGFDESFVLPAGEDLELALRVRAAGLPCIGAPAAVVNHAVEPQSLREALRLSRKWAEVVRITKLHPAEIRPMLTNRVFWRPAHRRLTLALVALVAARRWPPAGVLAVPYLRWELTRRGWAPASLLRCLTELPGRATVDLAETLVLLRASARHRTLVL